MLNYQLSQKLKLIRTSKFIHLTIALTGYGVACGLGVVHCHPIER
jgi:hypothetical protein